MIGVVLSNFSMTLIVLAPAIGFLVPFFGAILPDLRRQRREKREAKREKVGIDYRTISLHADGILTCRHDQWV